MSTPDSRTVTIDPTRSVTALHYAAEGDAFATLVLGHGAGANQFSAFMTGFASAFAARGLHVVTFNFPYTESARKLPDTKTVLLDCYRAVVRHVAADPVLGAWPLVIGGKSMGGRMASYLAAAPGPDAVEAAGWWSRLRGLVFLGYPLHPPARPQQVRVDHLPAIVHPMLFVQGAKDAFGTPDEIRAFTNVLPARCTLVPVDQADHSFEVTKRSGIPQADVYARIQDTVVDWIGQTCRGSEFGIRNST